MSGSSKHEQVCDRHMGRVLASMQKVGFADNARFAVGHTVQYGASFGETFPLYERRDSKFAKLADTSVCGADKPCGLNAVCGGRIVRLDVGMSRAFDHHTNIAMRARRPQAMLIRGRTVGQLESDYDLAR